MNAEALNGGSARFASPGIRLASHCPVCGQRQQQQHHSKPAPAAPMKCASQDGSMSAEALGECLGSLRIAPVTRLVLRTSWLIAATHCGPPQRYIMFYRLNPRGPQSRSSFLPRGRFAPFGLQSINIMQSWGYSGQRGHRCPPAPRSSVLASVPVCPIGAQAPRH